MSLGKEIEQQLQATFAPEHLEVVCDSHKHNVPAGTEIHFSVVIVSSKFEGQMLLSRHRLVNSALSAQFAAGIHALSIHALTPQQWAEKSAAQQQLPASPACLG